MKTIKLSEIRSRGFYTDGERVFRNETGHKGGKILVYSPRFDGNKMFLKTGVTACYYPYDKNIDVRLVEAGETFQNGDIKVIDVKTLEIFKILYIGRKVNSRGETINLDEIEYVKTFVREVF